MEKISIITVVFNRKIEFEKTLENILSQTHTNLEIIIIDGGSSDGTLDVIKKNNDKISYWVSEPDEGIYSAMNKGIEIATGEWINFLNAGDYYYNNDTLKNTFNSLVNEPLDLLIGDSVIKYDNFSRDYVNGNINEIWKGAQFIHQSCFIRTGYQKNNLYNEKNVISADFEFFFKSIYLNNITTKNLNTIISVFSAGGLSDNKRVPALISNFRLVLEIYRPKLKVIFFYFFLIQKEIYKSFLKKILSKNIISKIQKYIYGKN
ncbi:glycosyltransferase [Gammaproteobacteria bacterium]|nr:glycosyltransferase [Gammaproteobacteria bacterium]